MMLDLRDHAPGAVPRGGLIVEAPVAHQRSVTGPAPRPGEEILDGPLQHLIGRESNGVRHATQLQRLVDRGKRKGCVGANDDALFPILVTINDGQEDLLPPARTGDVARSELGGQAVALLIEGEERMVADGLEVAVVRRLLSPWTGLSELSMSRVTRPVTVAARCTSSVLRR